MKYTFDPIEAIEKLENFGKTCIAKSQSAAIRLEFYPEWRDEVMLSWLSEANNALSGAEAIREFYLK